jgi:hypothetical protein
MEDLEGDGSASMGPNDRGKGCRNQLFSINGAPLVVWSRDEVKCGVKRRQPIKIAVKDGLPSLVTAPSAHGPIDCLDVARCDPAGLASPGQ